MDAYQIRAYPDPYEKFGIAQAFKVGNLVFMSGQIGMNGKGEVVGKGDIVAQATQAFENIRAILREAETDTDRIVKITTYVTDMSLSGKLVEVWKKYLAVPPPAETRVEVKALALPDLLIEIDATALVGGVLRPPLPQRPE